MANNRLAKRNLKRFITPCHIKQKQRDWESAQREIPMQMKERAREVSMQMPTELEATEFLVSVLKNS